MAESDAVEPEPAKPTKKTYRAGPSKVFGVEPGETFSREIPPAKEERLLQSGAIKESRAQSVDVKPSEQTPAPTKSKE